MNKDNNKQDQNTTELGSIAQLGSLAEAFSLNDFSNISMEELKNDPAAAKIITILYAQSEKEKKISEEKVSDLTAKVKFYQAIQITNIAFAIVSVIGTIIVGFGISLDMKTWLIILGSILVLCGEIMPIVLNRKGEKL